MLGMIAVALYKEDGLCWVKFLLGFILVQPLA